VAAKTKNQRPPATPEVRRRVWFLAVGFLLVQILVLPGAASPFRMPKEVLALILILLVAGLSTAGQCLRGRISVRWSALAAVLLVLPLIQAASGFWSSSPRLALTAALNSFIWIAGALWIATAAQQERLRLVDATAIGAAISAVVLMTQAAGLAIFSLGPAGPSGRLILTGLTGNPADLSMAAVLILPLILTAGEAGGRSRFRWALAILLTGAAIVSQTLTAFVALGFVWTTWLFQQRSRRLWITATATAMILLAVGLFTGLDARIHRQLQRLEDGDWYSLLSARSDGWTAAAEMTRTNPVLGVGATNFGQAYYPARVAWLDRTGSIGRRAELATHFRFSHCDPLQMIAELGVPGLIWMIALMVVIGRDRPRGDPLPPLALAAFVPFALLHFPTHLAVSLVPLILTLSHLLATGREVVLEPRSWSRVLAAVALVLATLAGTYWQLNGLVLNLWRGGLDHALTAAQALDDPARSQQAAAVESQILPRMPGLGGARPWLWRMVGQARLARGDDAGAETAFRDAMALWPHEEAEFGLGLALAAQDRRFKEEGRPLDPRNRRGEAIVHLARVCRTNPALLELIDDEDLRHAVAEIVEAEDGAGRRDR
jgi:O-antigen ligase